MVPGRGIAFLMSACWSRSNSAIAIPSPSGISARIVPPWIDDHTVAVSSPVAGMRSVLRGSDHKDLIFDRMGTDQNLPVSFTGPLGKGGRGEDNQCPEIMGGPEKTSSRRRPRGRREASPR